MLSLRILAILACLLLVGCVTVKNRCLYDSDTGKLRYKMIRSTIIGKGDTNVTVDACRKVVFETHGTGISDNFAALAAAIAESARKASLAGAASSVIESLIKGKSWDELPEDLEWSDFPEETTWEDIAPDE